MRVLLFKEKVAKRALCIELPEKNQAILFIKNEDKVCGNYSILAFLNPSRDNLKRVSNYRK